jgi:Ca-activated chloride channel family protein
MTISIQPRLVLTPRRAALLDGQDNTLGVLVRVQAPASPAADAVRAPINLAIVIDRSGSMSGEPLHEACRCAATMIDGLDARDRVALVTYDDRAKLVVPGRSAGDKEVFRAALARVREGGQTNLHGGWRLGAEEIARELTAEGVTRAILLSDGNANRGVVEPQLIVQDVAAFAAKGIATSTYGLGIYFNEELMVAIAQAGNGNHYYGRDAEDLMEPFREEFDLLKAICARDLRMRVRALGGAPVEILNGYPQIDDAWRLPDLAYGGEAWAYLRVVLPAASLAAAARDGAVLAAEVELSFAALDGTRHAVPKARLALPVVDAEIHAATPEDELARRRADELAAAEMQEEARKAALAGDWVTVAAILAIARRMGQSNPWIADIVDVLEAFVEGRDTAGFARSAAAQSVKMKSRLSSLAESADRSFDIAQASYLRRKRDPGRREFDDAPGKPRGTRL